MRCTCLLLTQSGHRPRQAKRKPRVGHDRTDFSRRGSARLTSSHFDSFRICGDSSWCMRFYMRTLGRTSRKLLRRTVCIFFDHFGQRPRTKARQMLPRLEQLACASLFSDRGTTHNQIGDPRVFGCQKADPEHIRLIKLERISINVRLPNLKFGVTQPKLYRNNQVDLLQRNGGGKCYGSSLSQLRWPFVRVRSWRKRQRSNKLRRGTASRNAKHARVLLETSGWELMADISRTPPVRPRKALWPSA